ncbi:glycosyl transferase family 2 [Algoriphagus ratkowskyi]|nr:glycosyl transferase family 2 [Algoriphagus ratkowskyi]
MISEISVSVIIPTYNRKKLLSQTLTSILACRENDLEILVVDDGSTDGTDELMNNEFPGVKYFKQNNQGAPTARNLGLKNASGSYVIFIDSDDLVEINFFKSKLKFLQQNEELDAVYGPWDFFEGDEDFEEKLIIPRHSVYPMYEMNKESEILKNLLAGWFVHPGTILWKKSSLKKIEGFREELIINQDVDLLFRAIHKGLKISGNSGARALIREHQSDRVGIVKGNPEKIIQILNLRKFFKKELESSANWNQEYASAMASYTFELWTLYRKSLPLESKKLLQFSKSLDPNLQIEGGLLLRVLGKIFGSHRAVIIKQAIKI